jgi:arylformamidase
MLAVCSSRRAVSCAQARRFAEKAAGLGGRASVLPQDLSHMQVNNDLGEPGTYTDAVEAFLRTLDPAVARALGGGA